MDSAFEDEIMSINSIYGDETLTTITAKPGSAALKLPFKPSIVLRLEVPDDYPDVPLAIVGTETIGDSAAKGFGAVVVSTAVDVLAKVYTPGEVCIYDLLEELATRPELDDSSLNNNPAALEKTGCSKKPGQEFESVQDLGTKPPWTISEPITEKKSVFLSRVAAVTAPSQAKQYVRHLLATDKKAAKASHNMTAWRIRGENGATYQDCDDDGETAAGSRMLHLMQLMDVWDVMVVVTRWYGGVHLGPDRFRIINQAARAALIAGGFANDGEASKKSLKK